MGERGKEGREGRGSGRGGMHAPFLNSWIRHWLRVRYGSTRLCHVSTILTDETRRDSDQRVVYKKVALARPRTTVWFSRR